MKFKWGIKKEKGQIIVLLAISLVVILIVAALAVDGGMIYTERRFAQNAADAASLAGGGAVLHSGFDDPGTDFSCPASSTYNPNTGKFGRSGNIIAVAYLAARTSALSNHVNELPYLGYIRNGKVVENYGIDADEIYEKHGVVVECTSDEIPNYIDTNVKITSSISTAFAHLIYPTDLVTTNEAITRVRSSENIGYGNAIISLSETCKNVTDGGTYFAGSAVINIIGGGTFSNSCLVANGTSSLSVTVGEDYELNLVYENADLHPEDILEYNADQDVLVIDYLDEPDCSEYGEPTSIKVVNNQEKFISSGNYSRIDIQGGEVTFQPGGLFCMTGDLTITGGRTVGDGVTFFMQQDVSNPNNPKNSNITITGNAIVLLSAQYLAESETFGILFFMDSENEGIIKLIGTNESYFAGLIYAPTGFIDVGGTSSTTTYSEDQCATIEYLLENACQATTFSTQLIGWSVRIKGDGDMNILFDDTGLPRTDTNMYLKN